MSYFWCYCVCASGRMYVFVVCALPNECFLLSTCLVGWQTSLRSIERFNLFVAYDLIIALLARLFHLLVLCSAWRALFSGYIVVTRDSCVQISDKRFLSFRFRNFSVSLIELYLSLAQCVTAYYYTICMSVTWLLNSVEKSLCWTNNNRKWIKKILSVLFRIILYLLLCVYIISCPLTI
jgi:hypothetical protein